MRLRPIPFLLLYIIAWVFLGLSFIFIRYARSVWLLFLHALFLGGLFLLNSYILPYPHIRNFSFYKSEEVLIRGVVTDLPEIKLNLSSFILAAQQLTWQGKIYSVCGKVRVKVFRKEDISYADQLIIKGKLFYPYQSKRERFSYRHYLENQDIYSILAVSGNIPIKYLKKSRINFLRLITYKIREKSRDILFRYLKPTGAGIYSAMILGERSKLPPAIWRLFIQTGTVHILAISGLHVGIVVFILDLFLKSMSIKRKGRYILIILLLIFYCLLTGARPSVIRATVMTSLVLSAILFKKDLQISHSLALAALIMLMVNPRQLFNPGFQLSFASVLSIVYLSPVVKNTVNLKSKPLNKNKLLRVIVSVFAVSFAAWAGVLPFVAYYFNIVSPVTVLANMLVVPYLFLVISLGFSFLIIGFSLPVLAPVFAASANLSIAILIQMIKFFSRIPCAYFYLAGAQIS